MHTQQSGKGALSSPHRRGGETLPVSHHRGAVGEGVDDHVVGDPTDRAAVTAVVCDGLRARRG